MVMSNLPYFYSECFKYFWSCRRNHSVADANSIFLVKTKLWKVCTWQPTKPLNEKYSLEAWLSTSHFLSIGH